MGTSIEDKKNDEGPQRYAIPAEAHAFLSLYENREAGFYSSAIARRGLRSAKENQTGNCSGMLSDRWSMRCDPAD
jgi:hypothetical protein